MSKIACAPVGVRRAAFAASAMLGLCTVGATKASAQSLYTEDFDTNDGGWNINALAGGSDESANLFFDYSTVGIPSAPNSVGGTTRGVKLQANLSGGTQTGLSISPTGLSLPNEYVLRADMWINYNGPLGPTTAQPTLPVGGSGSTNLALIGVGTPGTTVQWGGSVIDSIIFGASGDGGTTQDYRAYKEGDTPANSTVDPTDVPQPYYAGTDNTNGTTDSRNNLASYYNVFGGETAPAAQLALYSQQQGQTATGAMGFAWRDVVVTKTADSVTWAIDGLPIATIPTTNITLDNNFLLGYMDINGTSSSDPNDVNLLFGLYDNVRVEVPEPTSAAALGVAALGLLARRRRRHA